jgi:hypothetical protein
MFSDVGGRSSRDASGSEAKQGLEGFENVRDNGGGTGNDPDPATPQAVRR